MHRGVQVSGRLATPSKQLWQIGMGIGIAVGASGAPQATSRMCDGVEDVVESLYPDGHPLLQAESVDEVCDVIVSIADQGLRTSIGRASRQWVLDHHERSMVAQRCEAMLKDLLGD